jgi:hypothetical protein
MGHSSIQVTVDTYGHLVPGADIAWVDKLDAETNPQPSATWAQPEEVELDADPLQPLENISGPARIRTWDQRIMSPFVFKILKIRSRTSFESILLPDSGHQAPIEA